MFSRVPFMGFVIPFILGIILMDLVSIPVAIPQLWQLVLLLFSIFVLGICSKLSKNVLAGVFLFLVFLQLGSFVKNRNNQDYQAILDDVRLVNAEYYEATVTSLPQNRSNSVRIELKVDNVKYQDKWYAIDAKIQGAFPLKGSEIPKLNDHLLIKGSPKLPKHPLNPLEFDYAQFLENRGIHFTDYVKDDRFITTLDKKVESFDIRLNALTVSAWAEKVLRQEIQNDRAYGLIKAMLLGRRDDLHTDQIQDFTISGTVHIISVSGLHVGVLVMLLSFLLGWIKRFRFGKYVFLGLIISILLFYSIITGLPPSVIRASVMFSILFIGHTFNKKNYALNALAISAILILLFDPNAIYNVGFQLSFTAMLGIFLFYPMLSKLYLPSNLFTKFVWDISVLTIAAQLGTFPLSIFYFHQFPTYFLLVNPLVILLANILVIGPILILLFCHGAG